MQTKLKLSRNSQISNREGILIIFTKDLKIYIYFEVLLSVNMQNIGLNRDYRS